MKTTHAAILPLIALSVALPTFASASGTPGKSRRDAPNPAGYSVHATRRDSPDDFNAFLNRCSLEERVSLMQALMGFENEHLSRHHFGLLSGLKDWTDYASRKKDATPERPIRPKTFNDVPPETVVDAIRRGILPESCVSPAAIRKELQWTCCSKLRFHALNHRKVNYHKEALQWVCEKRGIPKSPVRNLSTYELERKFVERYFAQVWDSLKPAQKAELLRKIEKSSKSTIANKAGIAAMSGGAAMAALGTTVAFTGFAFYTTMSTVIASAAGWVGATLPFSAYTGASTTVAVCAGPVGWCIAGAGLAGGAVLASWPDSQRTANFVVAAHLIKARWAARDGIETVMPPRVGKNGIPAPIVPKGFVRAGNCKTGRPVDVPIPTSRPIKRILIAGADGTAALNTVVLVEEGKKTEYPLSVRLSPGETRLIELGGRRKATGIRVSSGGKGTFDVYVH